MIGNQYKCAYLWAPKVTPRDSRGTQNWQKSANEVAVKNKIYKYLQRRFSSSLHVYTF